MSELEKYFKKLRFDQNHHLGMGDIRLTIAQQEEILEMVKADEQDVVKAVNHWAMTTVSEDDVVKFLNQKQIR